jgi:putative ABC transport system permease protein
MSSLLIAAAGLSAVLIINDSAKQSYQSNEQFLIENVQNQIVSVDNKTVLSTKDYARLRRAGFTELVAIAQTRQHIYLDGKRITQRSIDHTGIDTFALYNQLSRPSSLSTSEEQKSATEEEDAQTTLMQFGLASFGAESQALVHPSLLASLQTSATNLNSDSPVYTSGNAKPLPMLQAVENASLGNDVIMSMTDLYRLYPETELSALLMIGRIPPERLEALKIALPSHLELQSLNNSEQDSELTSSFHLNLMAMALLMFVVCLFIVVNAVNLLLHTRMPWLKVCRQLGIGRKQLMLVQLAEVTMLTFFASIIGIILGLELAKMASPTVQATLENLYQVEVGYGQISLLSLFTQVFGISLVGCVCATLLPLQKLNQNLSSSKSIDEAKSTAFWHKITWACFCVFALVGIVLLNNTQALWLLLIATACVILAGCCILLINYPTALKLIEKLVPESLALLRVSTKQSVALSGKTKIACCAFFIAATSNIGMNLMVDSFRGATLSWLEQRLAADYYIYSSTELALDNIAKESGVIVHQRFENYTEIGTRKIQQFSYPSTPRFQEAMSFYEIAPQYSQDNIGELWHDFEVQKGVLVNQQFAFSMDYKVNDKVLIPHPSSGRLGEYEVLGIIYDFGNPYAQVLMPISLFDSSTTSFFIYSLQGDEVSIAYFTEALLQQGINIEKRLIETSELLRLSMQAFDDTFVITDGLNIVTLFVAALSLACAIVVIMNDVRPQNMLIRSLGVSAFKTQLLALFQYILLCCVALIFATPFGILLAWVLISDINYQAFSWTYPLVISTAKIAKVYGLSLLVVVLVIIIPLIRAGKRPLINDIRLVN